MATLTEAITATQRVIVVTTPGSAAPGLRFRLDDELLELSGFDAGPGRRERAKAGTTNTRWVVNRGVGESTPASHDAGTTLMAAVSASISSETLTPPAPFAGEGGGGVEVNSTPVTNIVAPGAVVVGEEATLAAFTDGGLVTGALEVQGATFNVTATGGVGGDYLNVGANGFTVNTGDNDVIIQAGSGTIDLASSRVLLGAFAADNLIRFDAPVVMWARADVIPETWQLGAGDFTLWLDKTNGAAKLMVMAKQADGTVVTAAIALSA